VRLVLAISALALLAGCGKQEAKAPKGSSFGQVLPGSASDAMLPYDTASSTPPLAPETYDAPDDAGPRSLVKRPAAVEDEVAPEVEAT